MRWRPSRLASTAPRDQACADSWKVVPRRSAKRKAIVTGGVSYHDALARPGQPLADFDALDVHELPRQGLEAYDLVVVRRSVDGDALWARRHQVGRFLDAGGVLVVFGEAWPSNA